LIVGGVNSTQSQLSTDSIVEEVTVQIERENSCRTKNLIREDLGHWLGNASLCDRIPCHSENAVEWRVKECVSGFLHCTNKSLIAVGAVLLILSKRSLPSSYLLML
uniref:Phlebovirus_G2 domain-containing protein n=1 Tax=Haemonchus placei TaxID=6290 RepID=A0A0N4VUE9_HAEPC